MLRIAIRLGFQMGFFRDLANGLARDAIKNAAEVPGRELLEVTIDDSGPLKRGELIGSEPIKVYTYYPEVIEHIPFDVPFPVEVISSPVTLVSPTGSKWNTDDNGHALSYDGTIFGAFNQKEYIFDELNDACFLVTLMAVKTGMYDETIPNVNLMCPHGLAVRRWYQSCDTHGVVLPYDEKAYLDDDYGRFARESAEKIAK